MALEKAYEPQKYESDIYQLWEKSGAFKPSDDPKAEPYCIIMPPPNANGDIHVGTAMFVIEDILVRFRRMQGYSVLWLPGTDHAGIETQFVFERDVLGPQGKTRFDLGPERFYDEVMAYTKKNQTNIISQLKSMGFSADWSRLKFTLDPDIVEIVYQTFKKLYDDKLIYRGNRIVNWCPRCQAAFADVEINHRQQLDPLYFIKYGPFVLATVRPETKFADTAVAVHPQDTRYQKWIGKTIEAEGLLGKFKLKVIADDHVNPDFGTGVVKVTPGHDPNDFEIGQRHQLEIKQVIDKQGKLTDLAGPYDGLSVMEARERVAKDLEAKGLVDHIDMNYEHSIAYHDRCGTVIEPLVTEQWFLEVEPLAKPAIEAIEHGQIKIVPKRFEKVYIDWLRNLHDWNISRQIWWGIPIPAYIASDGSVIIDWKSQTKQIKGHHHKIYQKDTDTFDTWFSSSQWPYATLMATSDFDRFYPTSVMETGRDILFLWVTRMVMMGLYRTGEVPFKTVYLHGLVLDGEGKKMSKSRGNVINPLEMTRKYGTDSLRLALVTGITPGNDGSLGEKKVEAYRNFCNKLWNVARFVLDKGKNYSPTPPEPQSLADHWITSRLNEAIKSITKDLDNYRFSEAGSKVYALLWDDFADWYIEASKVELNLSVLIHGLEMILKLAHPFAPFVTERIWQNMAWQKENLITAPWPTVGESHPASDQKFDVLKSLISEVRNLKATLNLAEPTLLHQKEDLISENEALIGALANIKSFETVEQGRGVAITGTSLKCWLEIKPDQLIKAKARLEQKHSELAKYLARVDRQLRDSGFIQSAPKHIVDTVRQRRQEVASALERVSEQIKLIQG